MANVTRRRGRPAAGMAVRSRAVRVSDAVWRAVKVRAAQEGVGLAVVVEAAVAAYVGGAAVEVERLRGEAMRRDAAVDERWGRR